MSIIHVTVLVVSAGEPHQLKNFFCRLVSVVVQEDWNRPVPPVIIPMSFRMFREGQVNNTRDHQNPYKRKYPFDSKHSYSVKPIVLH